MIFFNHIFPFFFFLFFLILGNYTSLLGPFPILTFSINVDNLCAVLRDPLK